MKPSVCLLVNELGEMPEAALVERYLPASRIDLSVSTRLPVGAEHYTAIVPFNYRKLIEGVASLGNVLVFHASELPHGRGWAPIYHSIAEGQPRYVVSGIRASREADRGDLILRASFPILPEYTATFLREVDERLFLFLLARVLEHWPDGCFSAVPQPEGGSFRPRRRPQDSEVDPALPLNELVRHLRAVEAAHPAYFYLDGVKYLVSLRPEVSPVIPSPLTIEYCASGEQEQWEEWA